MVTSHPAEMLGLSGEIGTLRPGVDADVSVLVEQPGRYILRDNEKTEVIADSLLQPAFCLRAGARHDATAPILPRAVAA
jgi:dihydroorotase